MVDCYKYAPTNIQNVYKVIDEPCSFSYPRGVNVNHSIRRHSRSRMQLSETVQIVHNAIVINAFNIIILSHSSMAFNAV